MSSNQHAVNRGIDFVFPKRLARLSYFLRALACYGAYLPIRDAVRSGHLPELSVALVLVAYLMCFVILPRLRDVGMSAWWLAITPVPVANIFLSAILLFRRTNIRRSELFSPHNMPNIDTKPDEIA